MVPKKVKNLSWEKNVERISPTSYCKRCGENDSGKRTSLRVSLRRKRPSWKRGSGTTIKHAFRSKERAVV